MEKLGTQTLSGLYLGSATLPQVPYLSEPHYKVRGEFNTVPSTRNYY